MPRYFFHIRHPDYLVPDEEGAEFPDDVAAQHEGLESARDITADLVRSGKPVLGWVIEIVDEKGAILDSVGAPEAIMHQDPKRTAANSS